MRIQTLSIAAASALLAISQLSFGQSSLHINAGNAVGHVSPTFYGLMTEEINYAYEGGLYGELIRNRSLADDPAGPKFWAVVQSDGGNATIALSKDAPEGTAITASLKLTATGAGPQNGVGVANSGYWGVPIRSKSLYHASFFAKSDSATPTPLTLSLESADGKIVYASAPSDPIGKNWVSYKVDLTTTELEKAVAGRFVITTTSPGALELTQVSLFPPTFNSRNNGLRPDIMQKLVDLQPKFLRFPGGNYVEGNDLPNIFNWKKTIGPLEQRPGHMSPWKYHSNDGLGLLEFCEWCEDMHAEPVLAVFAGYTLNGQHLTGDALTPYVQDAVDEIEYVTGDGSTKWGAQRIKDGHAAPFPLHYVEIGNEDNFDGRRGGGGNYDERFGVFFDAIKAKYPNLLCIATTPEKSRKNDVIDEHAYYARTYDAIFDAHRFDKRDRNGTKVFMGEWASRPGNTATTDLSAALSDAAFMTNLERNSDLVVMQCYAPLFVNVNPGAMQWHGDLIGYDALTSYGSPSYYAQKMFNLNLGDEILGTQMSGVPTINVPARAPGRPAAGATRPAAAPMRTIEQVFSSVTRDSKTGSIIIKAVNVTGDKQDLAIAIDGADHLGSQAQVTTLSAQSDAETNSITDPTHVVPVASKFDGVKSAFTYPMPPYSISILQVQTR